MYSLNSNNLKQQNSKMQKYFTPLTPQKRSLSSLPIHDQHLLKELSPQPLTIGSLSSGKLKLQILHSPIPNNTDLFSQLIQSQLKLNYEDYYHNFEILEEDSFEILDDLTPKEQASEQDSEMLEENDSQEDENGLKKRKRKSTAQIKMLKHELQVEPNWGKQKIAEMSQVTGLSQSQVYKWWWDQKKKNMKNERENAMKLLGKMKQIKKPFQRKATRTGSQNQDQSDQEVSEPVTKPKNVIEIEEIPETQKKVNKRLTFL